jgi:hypothetical protein
MAAMLSVTIGVMDTWTQIPQPDAHQPPPAEIEEAVAGAIGLSKSKATLKFLAR